MVKCGVFFEVRTEFLNFTYTIFGFEVLKTTQVSEIKYSFWRGEAKYSRIFSGRSTQGDHGSGAQERVAAASVM
jgi:hypothetical protein